MKVWIIETGEYEQRHVFGGAVSPERAALYVIECYSEPYKIKWEPVKYQPWGADDNGKPYEEYELIGHFEDVPGKSIAHTATFTITPLNISE